MKSALAFYIMSEEALMRVLWHDAAGDGVHTVTICADAGIYTVAICVGDGVHTVVICAGAGDGSRQVLQLRGRRSDDEDRYNL